MNLGVDVFARTVTPPRYQPGIGLRPGEDGHELAPLVPVLYRAMYESIAAHSRAGLNVVVDVGHHDPAVLTASAQALAGLPVLFVGVRCPIQVVMERRDQSEGRYVTGTADDPVPEPVRLWQERVHIPGIYDLEVDTSLQTSEECAGLIRARLEGGREPSAFRQLAEAGRRPART